jgi:hypothetical protein
MIPIISLVTSVKDYIEVVHKLIESDSNFTISNYNELGSIMTYALITLKNSATDFLSLNWLKNLSNLPVLVPEISSAMISEISVLDGYFHNTFQFLDTPLSYGPKNGLIYGLEKFVIGLINSCFFIIPTSTAHIITLRRFVMQGLEAGYIAGVGTIAGNIFWTGSIILGCRFFVIPWLSLDIFRYLLGFMLLIKYMWDSYNERRMVLEDLSKQKIFLLNFLLALTEQTSIYPFITNLSIGPESSILESFPVENYPQFLWVHMCYLGGLLVGSFSLLHLTCWFWENPAFKLYMWVISSFKVSTSFYSKFFNFAFLYLTMICAITSVPYYGLDYTLMNPLGFVSDDRIIDGKLLPETAFINSKASDKNTRRNRGRHGRRERWKRRVRKYRTFDASLYDQGVYDLFTIEDLNYGFDRFWLRRKMRNHRVRFRFFPGPWMRSFKKQLSKPRLESYAGPRQEFFRILFEQVYHPSFHKYNYGNKKEDKKLLTTNLNSTQITSFLNPPSLNKKDVSIYSSSIVNQSQNKSVSLVNPMGNNESKRSGFNAINENKSLDSFMIQKNLKQENSTLRKFVRKVNNRIKTSEILQSLENSNKSLAQDLNKENKTIYSKRWKEIFSKIQTKKDPDFFKKDQKSFLPRGFSSLENGHLNGFLTNFYTNTLSIKPTQSSSGYIEFPETQKLQFKGISNVKKENSVISNEKNLQILRYKSLLIPNQNSLNPQNNLKMGSNSGFSSENKENQPQTTRLTEASPNILLHPLNFYLKKEQAFQTKLNYYTPTVFRQFSIENNAPYFRVMMKRYFYYYKPTLRWKKTMKVASFRKARRKSSRVPRKLQFQYTESKGTKDLLTNSQSSVASSISNPNLANSEFSNFGETNQKLRESIPIGFEDRLRKPTSTYTVVGKRASRYRYQIYKDVLQHWYYSPFNRFLLKLDVDSFIRRQPNFHFLTKNEENLIHLRRFLLSEHYNTLRWYTYMQHYRSMKTRIGGTKSFSSSVYNQQFQGTFKKIRHLFAITPSGFSTLENGLEVAPKTVFKFDQPLYNESFNTNTKQYLNTFLIHEELLDSALSSNDSQLLNKDSNQPLDDLVGQSTGIVRQYLVNAQPIRQKIIEELISKRNYTELTQFLYTGQKTRGTKPILNNGELFNQEKNYLLTANEKEQIHKLEKEQLSQFLRNHNLKGDLWVNLLKKWKRRVNDQEFMKNYLSRRVEKREKREQKKQVLLEKKLAKLTSWLNGTFSSKELQSNQDKSTLSSFNVNLTNREGLTLSSGTQKALNEGIYSLEKLPSSSAYSLLNERSISKTSTLLKYKQKLLIRAEDQAKSNLITNNPISLTKMNVENLRFYSQLRKENEIQASLTSISNILQTMKDQKGLSSKTSIGSFLNQSQKSIPSGKKYLKALLTKTTNLSIRFQKNIQQYLGLKKVYSLFLPIQRKSLKNWRKKERALNKQKKSRKEFQNLSALIKKKKAIRFQNDYYFSSPIVNEQKIEDANTNSNSFVALRKKRDYSMEQETQTNSVWGSQYSSNNFFLTKQFKRKKSPQRRARIRRNRGVTRKRTLADSLKREFRNLRRYGEKVDSDSKKQQILEKINNYSLIGSKEQNKGSYVPGDNFNMASPKQRRSKQRKQRTWKQKRSKYSQKLRKYRKRRRNVLGKIRILSKQLKRVESKVQIQNWWWKNFLPSIRANSDALWQIEKDQQIREKLQEFSVSEILKRDSVNTSVGELQIGNKDFKPLALPQAIRLKDSLLNKTNSLSKDLEFNNFSTNVQSPMSSSNLDLVNSLQNTTTIGSNYNKENQDLIAKLYQNLLISNPNKDLSEQSSFLTSNTSIPFYAGWDESLRKFVVTNRLLSRRETGFQLQLKNSSFKDSTIPGLNPLLFEKEAKEKINNGTSLSSVNSQTNEQNINQKFIEKNNEHLIEFTSAPLKGMNAATTLYWQIPFTTYDPDQFFALGMDGFAPIGWKRFNFRHTILKSWLYYLSSNHAILPNNSSPSQNSVSNPEKKAILVKKETTFIGQPTNTGLNGSLASYTGEVNKERHPLIYKFNRKERTLSSSALSKYSSLNNESNVDVTGQKMKKNLSRRLKKRNRRVKKHPRAPVWFPSGPLLNQVLPVHYIYVFYKRARVPRDRYIKRRLQSSKVDNKKALTSREPTNGPLSPALIDYTLRKRVKTKRKYHRKKDLSKKMPIFPRRVKFLGENIDSIHWRPMSRQKLNKPIAEIVREQRLLRTKQRQKETNPNNKQPSLRVKQLRRRVQRQIIRTVWRYKPRAGGFVWPGDYLRLELVKAPKLQQRSVLSTNRLLDQDKQELNSKEKRKTKRKKKRAVQEWQIQPKKYLLEKHNLRVIKKKLEKANRLSKMKQRINELNYLI